MRRFCWALLSVVLISCAEPEQPFELPDNPGSLIASDSAKSWKLARRFNNGTRMNMGDCFLAHRMIFQSDRSFETGASGRTDCGDPMLGTWSLARDPNGFSYIRLESNQIPEMMNIQDDFKLFKIKSLSDTLMILQFKHAQTTKKQTTIVDYFVPDGVKVDDRKFHW